MGGSPLQLKIHVRFRGNIFGPFSPDELRDMIRRGKSANTWEISLDCQSWRPIQELESLLRGLEMPDRLDIDESIALQDGALPAMVEPTYPGHPSGTADTSLRNKTLAGPHEEAEWYYADGDNPVGPVPESHMITLIQQGELTPNTLVWTRNMENWRPITETRLKRAVIGSQASPSQAPAAIPASMPEDVPEIIPSAGLGVRLPWESQRMDSALILLACLAGLTIFLKLLNLFFQTGGIWVAAEIGECFVLGMLILVALAARFFLRKSEPSPSSL